MAITPTTTIRNDYQTPINNKTVPTASGSGRFWRNSSTGASGGEFGTSGYDPVNQITAGVDQNSLGGNLTLR